MSLDDLAIICGTDKSSIIHNYTPIYENHFNAIQNKELRLLEIGIDKGTSLQMWHKYFINGKIFGIDINPPLQIPGVLCLQGSQEDPQFLHAVHKEHGPFDIIVDDGSHFNTHMRTSFDTLFPLLNPDGTYVVEDLHCCYWRHTQRPLFIDYLKGLIGGALYNYGITDKPGEAPYFDMSWGTPSKLETTIESIEFYKDIVFIKKKKND